ncbi:MAG TPA: molybdopterin-dependent oxidoreductase [Humisphaera sp.]|jgi:DMSO/TMAO reductase YedYZ molybdopterin-dependent catalytic subunit|nr:molybdopterin-dependent oxidoreductase [Humisphaera sp.]
MHRTPSAWATPSASFSRRNFLQRAAIGAGAIYGAGALQNAIAQVASPRFPEKADLILLTDRPPNLEMPLKYLREDLTPNEAFYVRWHLGVLPTVIDTAAFRLELFGHVQSPLSLSLEEIRKNFEPVSVVAVNQCSGNSRSFYEPRMPGVQWGNGAIGNARWTGVRLKDLLAKANVKAKAVDVSFNGLDGPTLPAAANFAGTPDFEKSLPFDRANDGEVIVAYEMNGQPLPMLNGFPLRLIVPGWYATYWVKALNQITVLDKPFDGFWMAKAYRVPNTPSYQESAKDLAKETVPISRMTVRSLFAAPLAGESIGPGPYEVQGVALDGGSGIAKVELSGDGGKTWNLTKLDADLGRYSWRRWRFNWRAVRGRNQLMVRATANDGQTQTTSQWNRSGYGRNVIESMEVVVA